MIDYYHEDRLAHAYLISTNNNQKCMEVLLNVIKNLFCDDEYSEKCNRCSLCHLIDINALPSLKIINPDGALIKKNQVLELRNIFSKSSQITNKNIYIINQCEKMNKESANTILKFLEEPSDNVIGFFITNHLDNVLPTIQSRCQQIDIIFQNELFEDLDIDKDKFDELIEIVSNYLNDLEVERKELILYNKKYFSEMEREDIKIILKILLDIYQNYCNNCYNIENKYNNYNYLKSNSPTKLKRKVDLIIKILGQINYNVNIELLLDRFVLEMDGINNEGI